MAYSMATVRMSPSYLDYTVGRPDNLGIICSTEETVLMSWRPVYEPVGNPLMLYVDVVPLLAAPALSKLNRF